MRSRCLYSEVTTENVFENMLSGKLRLSTTAGVFHGQTKTHVALFELQCLGAGSYRYMVIVCSVDRNRCRPMNARHTILDKDVFFGRIQ